MAHSTLSVFISSTNRDLFAHRRAVHNALLRLKNIHPIGMEHFGAQNGDATEVSLKETAACDLFVGIYAYRYGYRPSNGPSITEMEYREAIRHDIPRFIYVIDENQQDFEGWSNLNTNRDRDPEGQALLADFKAELARMRVWDTFTTPDDLAAKVSTAISNWMQQHPFEGWHLPTPHSIPFERIFVGREREIAEIRRIFEVDESASVTVSITGAGGVGKSYVASHLATILKDEFPGGVFHVTLGPGAQDTASVMAQVLPQWAQAHPSGRHAKPEEITPQKVKTWLAYEGRPGRILMILDDVWHDAPARSLKDLLPPGSGCIVTTRNRQMRLGGKLYELGPLPISDARKLLEARLGKLEDRNDIADKLISLLEGHPLALEVAASQVLDNGIPYLETITEYVAQSMQGESPFADLVLEYGDNERDKSVEVTLALSYEQLPDRLKTRFRTLGVFPVGLDYSERSIFALWETDADNPEQSKTTRAELLKLFQLCLMDQNEQTGRYSQHALLQVYGRALAKRESEYEALNARYITHVINGIVFQFSILSMEQWDSVILSDREHIHYVGNWLVQDLRDRIDNELLLELLASPKPPFAIPKIPPNLHGLLRVAEYFADMVQSYVIHRQVPEGVRWLHLGLICARFQSKEKSESVFLNALAMWHQQHGYLEAAKDYYEANLSHFENQEESLEKTRILVELSSTQIALGNLEAAINLAQQSLPSLRKFGDKAAEAKTLNEIGIVYRFRGQWAQAFSYFQPALAIARVIQDRTFEAAILDNIGQYYLATAEFVLAREHFDQALVIRREIGDRVGQATTLNNLACLHSEQGDPEQAVKILREVVTIYHEHGAVAHEAAILSNLAIILYDNLNQTEEAIALVEQSVAILEQYDLAQDATGDTIGLHKMILALMKGGKDFLDSSVPEGLPLNEAREISIALTQLVHTPNLDAFRAFIELHPEQLLKPEADILFAAMLATIPKNADPRAVDLIRRQRAILALCTEHGIEVGFQRAQAGGLIPSPPSIEEQAIIDAFEATLRVADLSGVKAAVEHYAAVLLTPKADPVIERIIDMAPSDLPEHLRKSLRTHHDILKLCREFGVEEGFRQAQLKGYVPMVQLRQEEAIAKLIWDSLDAADLDSIRDLIERFAYLLLKPEADLVIEQIIKSAPDDADPTLLEAIRQRRELLRLCREVGVQEAFKRAEQTSKFQK